MRDESGKTVPSDFTNLRQQAEKRLSQKSLPELTATSFEDARRVIAELQVYQIELEMQNEELRQTQLLLKLEREKYADLYNFAPVAYFILDERDIILDLNLAAAELLGGERKRLFEHPITPYLTYASLETFASARREALQTGMPQVCELTIRLRAGEQIQVQTRTIALKTAVDNKQLWRAVMTDVSELKRVEAELRESEERFRSLAVSMNDVIYTLDTQQRHTGVYGEWVANSGLTPEYFLGKTARELFGADAAHIHEEANHAALHGENVIYEWSAPSANGTIHYQTSVSPLRNAQGEIVGVVGAGRDITERKLAEERLRASERENKTILQTALDGFWVVDMQGRFLDINEAYCRMIGYSREELLEMSVLDVDALENEIHVRERMQRLLENGSERFETRHRRKDGRLIDVEVSINLMSGTQKSFVFLRDITERKRAEEQIRQLNANLEQRVAERTRELLEAQEKLVRAEKLAALGQMAGSVGHELRNPLGVISNAAYYLKLTQTDAPDKVKEYFNLIERNVRAADKIVTDLLDFTRVKSLDRARVSIPLLARQTLERFPPSADIQVELDLPEDLPPAYADPQHVVQILGNLTLNACQAMPRGGTLSISARARDEKICVKVTDTGSGISPEIMAKLFEPLFTTKPKGVGLGLAVCRNLIGVNGGSIEVESQVGAGSVFSVYFPVFK